MSSTANLQTDTLVLGPPKFGDKPCPPPCGRHTVNRHASLTLAHCGNAAELLQWLDMLGLPPCERTLRTSHGERNRAGVYGEAR